MRLFSARLALLLIHFLRHVSELPDLTVDNGIERFQDQAQVILCEYLRQNYPRQPSRFGKLLLLIPHLKTISGSLIGKLFFKETIGNVPVEKLVCDIFQSEKILPLPSI